MFRGLSSAVLTASILFAGMMSSGKLLLLSVRCKNGASVLCDLIVLWHQVTSSLFGDFWRALEYLVQRQSTQEVSRSNETLSCKKQTYAH